MPITRSRRPRYKPCKCFDPRDPANPDSRLKYYLSDPDAGIYGNGPHIVHKTACAECNARLSDLTASVVASYVANNALSTQEFTSLIAKVHNTLSEANSRAESNFTKDEQSRPTSAQIRKSITPDALISFVDGKPYKSLKRHLSKHGLTLDTYRAKYGLPADYPTVSANYSAARSTLARSLGLGQKRRADSGLLSAPTASTRVARSRKDAGTA